MRPLALALITALAADAALAQGARSNRGSDEASPLPERAAPEAGAGGSPEFGTDASEYARDGECDDPRFRLDGPDDRIFLSGDRFADAADCRAAWEAGEIVLAPGERIDGGAPDFGSDSGEYTRDGECDDPRFEGPGMTGTTLIEDDVMADAADCRAAWEAGRLDWDRP